MVSGTGVVVSCSGINSNAGNTTVVVCRAPTPHTLQHQHNTSNSAQQVQHNSSNSAQSHNITPGALQHQSNSSSTTTRLHPSASLLPSITSLGSAGVSVSVSQPLILQGRSLHLGNLLAGRVSSASPVVVSGTSGSNLQQPHQYKMSIAGATTNKVNKTSCSIL